MTSIVCTQSHLFVSLFAGSIGIEEEAGGGALAGVASIGPIGGPGARHGLCPLGRHGGRPSSHLVQQHWCAIAVYTEWVSNYDFWYLADPSRWSSPFAWPPQIALLRIQLARNRVNYENSHKSAEKAAISRLISILIAPPLKNPQWMAKRSFIIVPLCEQRSPSVEYSHKFRMDGRVATAGGTCGQCQRRQLTVTDLLRGRLQCWWQGLTGHWEVF